LTIPKRGSLPLQKDLFTPKSRLSKDLERRRSRGSRMKGGPRGVHHCNSDEIKKKVDEPQRCQPGAEKGASAERGNRMRDEG